MLATALPGLPLLARGKVRDLYDAGATILIIATDRVSAFDVVMPNPIPDKGRVLTALSAFWFRTTRNVWPNHFLTAEVDEFPPHLRQHAEILRGRAMLCLKADKLPFECVARGYVTGSIWQEYRRTGTIASLPAPAGLLENDRLPEPLFTPATKTETGHDENLSVVELADRIGAPLAAELQRATLAIYAAVHDAAAQRGVIVADTKIELGMYNGKLIVIDELATPDSSRFWPANAWRPGGSVPSYDKQPLRDYLEQSGWNKQYPAPHLPDQIIRETSDRYRTILARLTDATDADH